MMNANEFNLFFLIEIMLDATCIQKIILLHDNSLNINDFCYYVIF